MNIKSSSLSRTVAVLSEPLRRPDKPEPDLDRETIMAAALASRDETVEITRHAGERFDSAGYAGSDLPVFARCAEVAGHWLTELRDSLRALQESAARTDRRTFLPGDGTPWELWDKFKVALLAAVSVVLLATGVFSVGQILMASGIPGFDDPVRATLFSFVPVAAAFGVKSVGSLTSSDRGLRHYTLFVLVPGLALAAIWTALFVRDFGSMGDSMTAILDELDSGFEEASSGSAGATLFIGILTEILLAGALWLEIERIIASHRGARSEPNPVYVAIEADIAARRERLADVERLTSDLAARRDGIAKARSAFVARVVAVYRLRRDGIAAYLDESATPSPRSSRVANPGTNGFTGRLAVTRPDATPLAQRDEALLAASESPQAAAADESDHLDD